MLSRTGLYLLIVFLGRVTKTGEIRAEALLGAYAVILLALHCVYRPYTSIDMNNLEFFSLATMVMTCLVKCAMPVGKRVNYNYPDWPQSIALIVCCVLHMLFLGVCLQRIFGSFLFDQLGLKYKPKPSKTRCYLRDGDKRFDYGSLGKQDRRRIIRALVKVLEHYACGFYSGNLILDPAALLQATIKRAFIERAKIRDSKTKKTFGKEMMLFEDRWRTHLKGGPTSGTDANREKLANAMAASGESLTDKTGLALVAGNKLDPAKLLRAEKDEDHSGREPPPINEVEDNLRTSSGMLEQSSPQYILLKSVQLSVILAGCGEDHCGKGAG